LIGRTETQRPSTEGWLARLASCERRYLAVDGGSGARLLVRLLASNPYLRRVSSPRHAELLVVCEPVSRKLAPSIVELYRAMPRPRRVLVIGEPGPAQFPSADLVRLEDRLPGVERPPVNLSNFGETEQRMLALPLQSDEVPPEPRVEEKALPLPGKQEREIATELMVMSLGPVQPLTAGPLRLLFVCDGEQIVAVQTEAGYAARGVARAMTHATWRESAALASALDPLAPIAGRLAYVSALEQLQHWDPDPSTLHQREALLAFERVENHVSWLVRFAEFLADDRLSITARHFPVRLAEVGAVLWGQSAVEWIVPQSGVLSPLPHTQKRMLEHLAAELVALRGRLEGNRALALRTAGIGLLAADRLRAVGASGPVLHASERRQGDVLSRLLMRLEEAADDLRYAARAAVMPSVAEQGIAPWSAPPGETAVTVAGPRGDIGVSLASDGENMCRVTWRRPSAALLGLIPELLTGQKLADAETIVASLDLAMAEADG